MAKISKAKDKEKAAQADIQKRVEGLFMGEEFPASASISQVEALKAHVLELEARLQKQQSAEAKPAPVPPGSFVSEPGPSITVDTSPKQHLPEPEKRKRSFFRDLLLAPKFGNLAQDRIANLQQNILMGLFLVTLLGLIINVATWKAQSINGFSILIFEFMLSLLALFLQRRGYLEQASWVLVSALYLVFLMGFYLTGFTFVIAVLLALTISLAGLLFRNRSVIAFTAFAIITLWVCSYIFVFPVPIKLNELIYTSIILVLEGLLLSLASATLERSFFEVDRSTQALMSTNQNLQNLTLNLEKRVGERTHDLELVIGVSQAVSGKSANLSALLREAVELIRERFDLYYTQIYLVDTSGRLLIMQAGTGNAGAELLRRDHRLLIASGSLNGRAAAEKRAIIVVDTQQDVNFLPNPLLPSTRSEMAVPLIFGEKIVGVLDMQSEHAGALNEANLPAFEALAGQLAVAIQNARLFTEIEAARLHTEAQVRRTTEQGWLDFLNSTDRGQKLGFSFDQTQVIQLKKEDLKPLSARSALNVPIQVTGARVGMIQVANESDRVWTNAEAGILKAAAEQLAQHIENLRLLDQADKYRLEAEAAVRRLTREGWGTYLQTHKTETVGFAFDLNEVYSLSERGTGTQSLATIHPLKIRDEILGEFSVNNGESNQDEVNELISAVSTQLSGHIENLRLTEQTESALNETETLYQASAELNIATTYDQILNVLRRYTLLGHDAQNISMNFFNRPWIGDDEPDWVDVLARWSLLPATTVSNRYVLSSLPSARQLLHPDTPTLIEDVGGDPQLDENARKLYANQFGAKSTVFAPLVIGGQWMGYINAIYQQSTSFPEADVRRLMTLAGQAAVAINNQRLHEQTQGALDETEVLYKASAELSIATTYDQILDALRRYTLLGNNAHIVSLNYFDRPWVGDAEPDWIDVLARWTTLTSTSAPSRYGLASLPSASQILSPDVPTLVEDVFTDPRMDANVRTLYTGQFGAKSTVFVPLVIGGQWMGYINGIYQQSTSFPEADVRHMMTLAGQAAVAINNLRLLLITQERVKREQALRQITTAVRASTDPATIMRTAVRELGNMLGRKTAVQLLNTEHANPAGPVVIDADESDSLVRKS